MKFIKLKNRQIEEVIANKSDVIGVINDQDDISVNDEVEFFNTSNVVFGKAKIQKIVLQKLDEYKKNNQNQLDILKIIGNLNDDSQLIKTIYFDFLPYNEPRKAMIGKDLNVKSIKIYADGGSRGNPGPSALGYVLMTIDDKVIKQNGVYLGITTNNQAEYKALLFALEDALELGSSDVTVFMDSLLVVNQLKGSYKVKNLDLKPIYQQIMDLVTKFNGVTFTHIPRELNKLADLEVNKCLDSVITP